jgi:beta-N-acetylhexosaminidase
VVDAINKSSIDLRSKPFNLDEEGVRWVETTLASMSEEEKVAQLFCLVGYSSDADRLQNIARNIKAGGLMCRPMPAADILNSVRILQENSRIPVLIAANLEKGGGSVATEGTIVGSQMLVAAADDPAMGAKLGTVCGREGAAVGLNWSFSPIIDIDYNFRNPITNTRTFGSDPLSVARLGVEYVEAVQRQGVAATIKHFPGDGMDERDQHLVSSINSTTCEQWDLTYGAAYKSSIDAGALSVMVGHILHPAYSRKLNPGILDEDILPATVSYELCTLLLRQQLGFNGLVVTDASTMAGLAIALPRCKAVPQAIAAGCDMFLFARSVEEDLGYMRKGIEDGVITQQRLHDALTRILGVKASLGLHEKKQQGTLIPSLDSALKILGNEEHKEWARECADRGITLVKEEPNVLPLSPDRYKKVLFYPIEAGQGVAYSVRAGVAELFKQRLIREGFAVDEFVPSQRFEGVMDPYSKISTQYDLIVYLANMATKSNQTTVRIEWAQPMGANVPIYMSSVPTIFISVENPYHLVDVPRVRTFINTYCSTDLVMDALIEKLMGRSRFTGKSPVDPFCAMWDTRLM